MSLFSMALIPTNCRQLYSRTDTMKCAQFGIENSHKLFSFFFFLAAHFVRQKSVLLNSSKTSCIQIVWVFLCQLFISTKETVPVKLLTVPEVTHRWFLFQSCERC